MKWAKVTVKGVGYATAWVPVPDGFIEGSVELDDLAWAAVESISSWGNLDLEVDEHSCESVSFGTPELASWGHTCDGRYEHAFLDPMTDAQLAALADDPTAPDFVRKDANALLVARGARPAKAPAWSVTGHVLHRDGTWKAFEHLVEADSASAAKGAALARWYGGADVARVFWGVPVLN